MEEELLNEFGKHIKYYAPKTRQLIEESKMSDDKTGYRKAHTENGLHLYTQRYIKGEVVYYRETTYSKDFKVILSKTLDDENGNLQQRFDSVTGKLIYEYKVDKNQTGYAKHFNANGEYNVSNYLNGSTVFNS